MGSAAVGRSPSTEKPSLEKGSGVAASSKPVEAANSKDEEPADGGFKSFVRIFTFARPIDYVTLSVALLGAFVSGAAMALTNLVLGQFVNILGDFSTGASSPEQFRAGAGEYALRFVYIGIARLAGVYLYATLSTRWPSSTAAPPGPISAQATSNGKLIQSGIAEKLGTVFQALATFVGAFIIAFVANWKLTLILICIAPALVIVMGIVAGADSKVEAQVLKVQAQGAGFAETILSSARNVHAFSLRARLMHRFDEYLEEANRLGNKKNAIYGAFFSAEYTIVYLGLALAFWQGLNLVARGEVPNVGVVYTVMMCVITGTISITSVAPSTIAFSRAASGAAELFRLIDRTSEINPFDKSGERPTEIEGSLEFDSVTFAYPTRPGINVLKDFSLQIPAGKVTALVGMSGSGKSTCIGLIERWYNPTAGAVKLDGRPINELNLNWLRTNVRLVQQEPVLFNGTVFENIANGLVGTPLEKASPAEQKESIERAAATAFAHDFIMTLPEGYQTRIGERGGLLSGGQKQRIAIARSIVSDPRILLLDEATSALDPHAEGIVQQALDNASRERTTVVIAHKLATIRGADNIVVMAKGEIVEQGTHDELLARGEAGAYFRMVQAQRLSKMSAAAEGDDDGVEGGAAKSVDSSDDEGNKRGVGVEGDAAMDDVAQMQSVVRYKTAEREHVAALQNRENFELYPRSGFVHTVIKLIADSPELKWVCSHHCPSRHPTLSRKVRRTLLNGYLRQDLQFFDRDENTVGALTARLDSHPQSVLELMGFNLGIMLSAIVSIVGSSILAIAVSWKLGLVGVFAGLPPLLVAGWLRIRLETKMDNKADARFSNSASLASESIMAIRTISSLATEESVLQKYTAELDRASSSLKRPLFVMMIWFAFTQAAEYFVLALGFWYGARLMSFGEATFYEFFVAFIGVFFAGQQASILFTFSSSFTKALHAANYYFWIKSLDPTIRETDQNRNKGPRDNVGSIELDQVRFAYPLRPDAQVLRGVSLQVKPGSFVALVGASGCGKSTAMALLERFYDPSKGRIIIDGADELCDLNPRLYRQHVSLVQQEPTLYPGSIRDNVAYGVDVADDQAAQFGKQHGGAEAVTDEQIEAALRAANAWDFVCSLPEGTATGCGTSGSQLSGGQRQRIAIARALVRDPRVLLLDEATSALDTESEKVVQAALAEAARAGGRITVAVAHRLSTVRDADLICVFYAGRIAEAGTHEELLGMGGLYSKMFIQGVAIIGIGELSIDVL
uniref:Leptomycin B resistance protein pmd1 n=1 Tax=Pyricularia oryzae (strain P131) TaxID=1143193 RepID=L7JKN7_PYRO1